MRTLRLKWVIAKYPKGSWCEDRSKKSRQSRTQGGASLALAYRLNTTVPNEVLHRPPHAHPSQQIPGALLASLAFVPDGTTAKSHRGGLRERRFCPAKWSANPAYGPRSHSRSQPDGPSTPARPYPPLLIMYVVCSVRSSVLRL
ncbi:hypothetical protein RRF57_012697 [Xylaria bambusicola]|uniref:Uncharacterized protein n=1 Tax=Xylaria bambusicola TaxID=326684 RepID=A0AAN7UQC0_9PEZI